MPSRFPRSLLARCKGPPARQASFAALLCTLSACAAAPSPLTPAWHGSIGMPGCGVLNNGAEVRRDAEGLHWLRDNDRHWAAARFASAIERAAAVVAHERPGSTLVVGDLSTRTGGGPLSPHFSHRSGLDADLLFYVLTLEGAPVQSPGFVHFGADGIARDEGHNRWLRLDLDRQWLLVRAILEDPQARVQWIFVSNVVKAMLIEWGLARGEATETVRRAQEVMLEPHPGGVHDDHFHVRTACSPDERVAGCEPSGPRRPWIEYDLRPAAIENRELVSALLEPPESLQPPVAQRAAALGDGPAP